MKKTSLPFALQLLIVAGMLVVGGVLYDKLPADVPSHWNAAGEIDGYMSRTIFVLLLPGITFAMTMLFPLLQKIDPLKKNYKKFEKAWDVFRTAIILFMAYLYFVTIYVAFNPGISIEPFVFVGIGLLFAAIGSCMDKIKKNYFVGLRTPWTLDSEKVWDKTHKLGKWTFIGGGALLLVNAFLGWQPIFVVIVAILLAAVVPFIYSYWVHKQ